MPVFEAHITGRVQGVGFRPYIYREAQTKKLKGWVCNDVDGVHLRFQASSTADAHKIIRSILKNPPTLANINHVTITKEQEENFDAFQITLSQQSEKLTQSPSPDFAICQECTDEMLDPKNRRYQYPFITCTNCGPRLSIMKRIPYDREFTSMEDFKQCPSCHSEYWNPLHRRFFSQTNSCEDCGIKMTLFSSEKKKISLDTEIILTKIKQILESGSILAIKGIGGFLLMADATNSKALHILRKRKNRPTKPFALMYPDISRLKEDLVINERQTVLLKSSVSPIVLLALKESVNYEIKLHQIAPGLDKLGVMLPYTGLFQLIFKHFRKPLIATSANVTNEPIVFDDTEALEKLSSIADFILIHNRPILFPQDDSVFNSCGAHKEIIIRRSRGLAPSFETDWDIHIDKTVFAFGAQLKSSFAISHFNKLYVSQYLGNQAYFETQERFEKISKQFLGVLEAKPKHILIDSHPDYISARLGSQWASELGVPLTKVFHHKAHFAAVLAENKISRDEKVLGVVWDGTGYGEDKQIWGGEFFGMENKQISRLSYFKYYDSLLGDQMAKLPALAALSLVNDSKSINRWVKPNFTKEKWPVYKQIKLRSNTLKTSSVGRLFDGVSSLLGFNQTNSYEGESAMYLEVQARKWFRKYGNPQDYYLRQWKGNGPVPTQQLTEDIVRDLDLGLAKDHIAAKFHLSLVKLIEKIAIKHRFEQIAFSGGVFQNSLLIDMLICQLSPNFKLLFHKELSPNDECISYGQISYAYYYGKSESKTEKLNHSQKSKSYVLSHTR
jgi:hydrogenase maturation protein HypF